MGCVPLLRAVDRIDAPMRTALSHSDDLHDLSHKDGDVCRDICL